LNYFYHIASHSAHAAATKVGCTLEAVGCPYGGFTSGVPTGKGECQLAACPNLWIANGPQLLSYYLPNHPFGFVVSAFICLVIALIVSRRIRGLGRYIFVALVIYVLMIAQWALIAEAWNLHPPGP
jgi:hypothetical protein